ncbi:hypothetical protein [[Limnothrix rosea] IAM M-220]|uniref:hypothetical protein n=1 Tax=[Limnothrix rosea] IAM M-220 TaxID=454133 RepID=UPI000967EAD2|nr:hypothetical protein [[Limnothrix rosea] IAM M-220]OKH12318.1 hypothetical protein NIES208_16355 [[Limnothrix rosea] IAM M-220]
MPNLTQNALASQDYCKDFVIGSSQETCVTLPVSTDDTTYYNLASHKPVTTDIEWLSSIYSHRSNPAVKPKNGDEYRSLKRTISDEKFLEYWRSPDQIIAIRFDTTTREIVIDVDRPSPYFNASSIRVIRYVLEDIGLVACVIHRSSEGGGVHLRYPLSEERNTYAIARTVTYALNNAGLWLSGGELEVFPNKKTWIERGKVYTKGRKHHELFDYNAIRVPLQAGYELLDDWLEPIGDNSLREYRCRWEWCADQQDLELLDEAIAHYSDPKNKPKRPRKFGSIRDIERDYKELLRVGFTSKGQTNSILGKLTRMIRILEPTTDDLDLAQKVMAIVVKLPGYEKYCCHQHHIEKRCLEWARCCIKKGYYYYGDRQSKDKLSKRKGLTNEEKQAKVLKRLQKCLKTFIKRGWTFPNKTSTIEAILKAIGGSKSTLQKYWGKLHFLTQSLLTKHAQDKESKDPQRKVHTPHTKSVCTGENSPAHQRCSGKKYLIPNIGRVSGSARDRLSSTQVKFSYLYFERLAQQYADIHPAIKPSLNLHYSAIPNLLIEAENQFKRAGYAEKLDQAIRELNRCDTESIWFCVQFLKSLPTVEEVS